jgi:hypothetical protein
MLEVVAVVVVLRELLAVVDLVEVVVDMVPDLFH